MKTLVAPICITSTVTVIGSSIDESVHIPCRVAGDPPSITFEWTFANSGERFDITSSNNLVPNMALDDRSDFPDSDTNTAGTHHNHAIIMNGQNNDQEMYNENYSTYLFLQRNNKIKYT